MEEPTQLMTLEAVTPSPHTAHYNAKQKAGDKRYELANHLGNVLNVVLDRKLPVPTGTSPNQTIASYTADVVSYSDYYPFGMQMPGRYGTDGYRYGFQGQEKDDEIKGDGNSYTTDFRQYDPRVGKWLSIDPKSNSKESPYTSMSNNPLIFKDQL